MARKAPFKERLRRRISIAGGRALRTLPNAKPLYPSVFFHMPKCGGTSLSEAMYATVPFNHRIGVIDAVSTRRATAMLNFGRDEARLCHEDLDAGQDVFDFREGMMLQHMAWDTMLIHGHLQWSQTADMHFGERFKYVTLLRDPLDRMISNYRMSQRTGVWDADTDAYLESPLARRHAQVFLRYLSGRNNISDDEVPEATDLAKSRLERFAVVGFLDHTNVFCRRYKSIFGVTLRMTKLNVADRRKPAYNHGQMRRFEELCLPDRAIYDHARLIW